MVDKVLQLPRHPRVDPLRFVPSVRSLAVGCVLVLIGAGLYGLARETSMFAVGAVRVAGAAPAVTADVERALQRYDGKSLVALSAADVEQHVDALPTVRSSTVDRAFPHMLSVRVVPELPVAVLRRGRDAFLVSARGRVIAPVAPTTHRALPRIWAPRTTAVELGAILDAADGGFAARSLAALVGSGLMGRVSFVRALEGQVIFQLHSGLELQLGTPVELRLKLAIARAVLPTLASPAKGGPDYLDLAVPERPVAGRNPQPAG
jgi:cell division septal protein FtsQ